MAGIIFLSQTQPDAPVEITVGRVAAIRDIRTTALHAPRIVADYAHRSDVHTVTWRAAGTSGSVVGAAAWQYAPEVA